MASLAIIIKYTRVAIAASPNAPAGIAHNEQLYRAWPAPFSRTAPPVDGSWRHTAFANRFHKVFGAPPLQASTDRRLEQAIGMLRETTESLIESAFAGGYNSEATLIRAFRRRYGEPMRQYRVRHAAAFSTQKSRDEFGWSIVRKTGHRFLTCGPLRFR